MILQYVAVVSPVASYCCFARDPVTRSADLEVCRPCSNDCCEAAGRGKNTNELAFHTVSTTSRCGFTLH